MTSERMLPAMDIHQYNENHEVQYRMATIRFPTENSNDSFELFECPYNPDHRINSRQWRPHLRKCKANYGGRTVICHFNASHHIPEPELEWHLMICPDKHALTQEFTSSGRRLATQVNHNVDYGIPECEEDWDAEADEAPSEAFSLDHRKGMPIHLIPKAQTQEANQEEEYYEEEGDAEYYDENGEEYYDENQQEQPQQQPLEKRSVLEQELLPEKPSNWETMSKAQKKNYKRKYNAQRQRMKEEGVTEADFAPSDDPLDWTEERRMAKLNAIKAKFPLASDKQYAERFDYASLLNIVCQKCRIHLPEFKECAAISGGFAYTCRIGLVWYKGYDFCTTKKDAKHECAKWALLGMQVPGIDNDQVVGPGKAKPVHPRMAEELQRMREGDELGKLMAANMYPVQKKNVTPLRQPKLQQSPMKENRPSPQPSPTQQPMQQQAPHSMQQYVQQQQQKQQQQAPHPMQQYVQRQQQQATHPMQQYVQQQQAQQATHPMQQYVQQQQQKQQQQQPRGWGQPPQKPPPGFAQAAQPAAKPTPPPPGMQQNGPARGWGNQNQSQQQERPQQQQQLVNGMQNLNVTNEDFPSLGGGASATNGWSTVTKKGSQGVKNPSGGRGRGGRGRGRGTTMKMT